MYNMLFQSFNNAHKTAKLWVFSCWMAVPPDCNVNSKTQCNDHVKPFSPPIYASSQNWFYTFLFMSAWPIPKGLVWHAFGNQTQLFTPRLGMTCIWQSSTTLHPVQIISNEFLKLGAIKHPEQAPKPPVALFMCDMTHAWEVMLMQVIRLQGHCRSPKHKQCITHERAACGLWTTVWLADCFSPCPGLLMSGKPYLMALEHLTMVVRGSEGQ